MFKKLRRWLDERYSLKHFGCACYCKGCDAVLHVRAVKIEGTGESGEYTYTCECGGVSRFDYLRAPVPILLEYSEN